MRAGASDYLAKPIAAVLFQRGAFLAEDARATAALLKMLALALPALPPPLAAA